MGEYTVDGQDKRWCSPHLLPAIHYNVPWCNGSTTDSGSVCPGSNPGGTAYICTMNNHSSKKQQQLGMPIGTASNRLKKSIMFSLLKRLNENYCFKCGLEITSADTLSVEHKTDWLDSDTPIELFFDLDNIAFSHNACNTARVKKAQCPSRRAYQRGCRCNECKAIHNTFINNQRKRKKKQ